MRFNLWIFYVFCYGMDKKCQTLFDKLNPAAIFCVTVLVIKCTYLYVIMTT